MGKFSLPILKFFIIGGESILKVFQKPVIFNFVRFLSWPRYEIQKSVSYIFFSIHISVGWTKSHDDIWNGQCVMPAESNGPPIKNLHSNQNFKIKFILNFAQLMLKSNYQKNLFLPHTQFSIWVLSSISLFSFFSEFWQEKDFWKTRGFGSAVFFELYRSIFQTRFALFQMGLTESTFFGADPETKNDKRNLTNNCISKQKHNLENESLLPETFGPKEIKDI